MRAIIAVALVCAALLSGEEAAYADAATEAQLRAALQNATAQIATLEDQVASLQASQAPQVATIEALRAQLQNVQKNGGGAAQPVSDAAQKKLLRQLAARNAALAKLSHSYNAAATGLTAAQSQNAALTAELRSRNAALATCQSKNTELYNLGNQILDAYAHKDDIFGAIADREPFIGFKRVQLQNIVQNDQDKLDDNQLAPQ